MKNILIVEDEEILLNVLKNRFEEDDWNVTTAEDGDQALRMVSKDLDLILLDLILPKKDGFEVLVEIKNNSEFKEIPIVVLSNLGADEDIKRALKLGASDYFVKTQHPIAEIIQKVKTYATE